MAPHPRPGTRPSPWADAASRAGHPAASGRDGWLWAVASGLAGITVPCDLAGHLQPGGPTEEVVLATAGYEVRIRCWAPGAWTDLHVHDARTGALCVVSGTIAEERLGPGTATATRTLGPGEGLVYDERTTHRIGNPGPGPATTLHVTTAVAPAAFAAAC